jgi:hypothetical protein
MSDPAYEERYCAFVDILGFKALVASLASDISKAVALKEMLTYVHVEHPKKPPFFLVADLRTQSISDALVVSSAANTSGLFDLFVSLKQLALRLLLSGYFVRGAIVKGLLYHDDKVIFGDALVRAYQYETTIVRFPRIMILSDVAVDAVRERHLEQVFAPLMRQADDGPMYLHVLNDLHDTLKGDFHLADESEAATTADYAQMKTRIDQRFRQAMDNPAHFEKVQWFARYWNSCILDNASMFRILGVGL